MSMKVVLVAAASVMAVSPALAMSKSEIVNHTGGPIPYSQLVSMDKSGYSARAHKHHKKSAAKGEATAANAPAGANATLGDQNAAPAAPPEAAAPAPAPATPASPPSEGGAPQ
jgi:hypothetical protein